MHNSRDVNTAAASSPSGVAGVTFVDFDGSLASRFKELNISWLKKYFYVEPIDEIMLSDPKKYIIDKDGYVFFAKLENETVGTFALMKIEDGVYELGKMAVDEKCRGRKIGNLMLLFCLKKAKELEIQKVQLYSNTILANAIHLYKKYGFIEVPLGSSEYKRSNIKMEAEIK